MSLAELRARDWEKLDVLLISGDAHVDHPAFGVPLLARLLIDRGWRVGIVAQPPYPGSQVHVQGTRVTTAEAVSALRVLGTPRLLVGIGSGVVDSMVNNYTANRRRRSDDSYAPGGQGGWRPDEASRVYAELARQAFPELPIVLGGVEASLRRLAHYDYWKNTVRRSLLFDTPADFLVHGMGETTLAAMVEALDAVERQGSLWQDASPAIRSLRGIAFRAHRDEVDAIEARRVLPSYSEQRADRRSFARTARLIEREANPWSGRTLVQWQGRDAQQREVAVVVTPSALPLTTVQLDAIYELPFTRQVHPSYLERALRETEDPADARKRAGIPALETVRHSIVVNRGCFGGCSFCGLGLHQGKTIQSRSVGSVLREIDTLASDEGFTGVISDLGGPTANMYGLRCLRPDVEKKCIRPSCLHPSICRHLETNHAAQIEMLRRVRRHPQVKKAFIASGVRHDLALRDPRYIDVLAAHHVGGHLKVAPEHADDVVLGLMRKPAFARFEEFKRAFEERSTAHGKTQYLVPYFISCFPGTTPERMQTVNRWLGRENWRLQQVQAFIPLPMTMAAAMYWSGLDPSTGKEVHVPRSERERRQQQALLQPHKSKPGRGRLTRSRPPKTDPRRR
ncbi:MAG: YgiQ family radical SAM protein [Pseudomonadota bacterium]